MAAARKAIIVGISGCSSSGKTTLSRLLRDIFPNTFVLHEDDFYRPETELPVKHGLMDWDSVESLSVPDIVRSLEYIHANGTFPPDLVSKEDRNSVGKCPVPDSVIESSKDDVRAWTEPGSLGHGVLNSSPSSVRLFIFDGFLLFSKSMSLVHPQMDLKLFLRVSYAKAKARREARSGYVTQEGFWEDPPGYVDKIVWPNYVDDHKWMFEGEDVEGDLREDVLRETKIQSQEGGADVDMTTTLKWAVELLMKELPTLAKV